MDLIEKARTVVGIETSQLNRLAERLDENFSKALGAPEKTLKGGHKIVVIGVGKSEHIGN